MGGSGHSPMVKNGTTHTTNTYHSSLIASLASCYVGSAGFTAHVPLQDQNTSALYKKILSADYKTPKFISEAGTESTGIAGIASYWVY